MSESGSTLEKALKKAEDAGLDVRTPEADELFVDIDSEADFQRFRRQLAIFVEKLPKWFSMTTAETFMTWPSTPDEVPAFCTVTPSKQGLPRRHVVVKLAMDVGDPDLAVSREYARVMLQALLGSDIKRELLGLCSMVRGDNDFPTMFFEKRPNAVPANPGVTYEYDGF